MNIQVGDVVLTSGLGGSYTPGLLIGTVARVEGSAGNDSRRIVVAPNGQVSLLEEAMVVFSAASDAVDRSVPVVAVEDGQDEDDEGGQNGAGEGGAGDNAQGDGASDEGEGN